MVCLGVVRPDGQCAECGTGNPVNGERRRGCGCRAKFPDEWIWIEDAKVGQRLRYFLPEYPWATAKPFQVLSKPIPAGLVMVRFDASDEKGTAVCRVSVAMRCEVLR